MLFNTAMKIEREEFIGAGPHERTEERRGYTNGYKAKGLQTRMRALELEVPQVRGLGFYPKSLEKAALTSSARTLGFCDKYSGL